MNITIWIRGGYPLSYDQYDALQQACGSSVSYNRKWIGDNAIDYVSIDNVNITIAKQLETALRIVHRYHAYLDRKYNGNRNNYCQNLEIYIQKPGENRPEWAEAKESRA